MARVSAQNEHGPGPYSVTDINSDKRVVGRPGEITGLKVDTTEDEVKLSWADSVSATSYEITYITEEEGE